MQVEKVCSETSKYIGINISPDSYKTALDQIDYKARINVLWLRKFDPFFYLSQCSFSHLPSETYFCHLPFPWKVNFREVKRNLKSTIANFLFKLPHELIKELRLKILENKKRQRKSHICVETEASSQFPLSKIIFGKSSQNLRNGRYWSFLVLPTFAFLTFGKIFWHCLANQIFAHNLPQSLSHLNIVIVVLNSNALSNFLWKYKQNQLQEKFQILQFSLRTILHVCLR